MQASCLIKVQLIYFMIRKSQIGVKNIRVWLTQGIFFYAIVEIFMKMLQNVYSCIIKYKKVRQMGNECKQCQGTANQNKQFLPMSRSIVVQRIKEFSTVEQLEKVLLSRQILEVRRKLGQLIVECPQQQTDQLVQSRQKFKTFRMHNCSVFSNGVIYIGQTKNKKMHGIGKCYLPDYSYLQGCFIENYLTGKGRLIHRNGNYYQGDFINNFSQGYGIQKENDYIYKGIFKRNKKNGKGNEVCKEYDFTGQFVNGQKLKGQCQFTNIFRQKHSQDSLLSQLQKFKGQVRNGKFHGKCTFETSEHTCFAVFQPGKKIFSIQKKNKSTGALSDIEWEHKRVF